MLQFLSGNTNSKWAPNENYARELMELFTLGADRGAYTETDIREAARALTGLAQRLVRGARRPQLPLRPEPPRHRQQDDLRQDRELGLEDVPRLCVENPLHAVLLRREALELLHPDAAGHGDPRRA